MSVGCLGIAVILLTSFGHVSARIDQLVYDRFLNLRSQPLLSDIVVVEIDNSGLFAVLAGVVIRCGELVSCVVFAAG